MQHAPMDNQADNTAWLDLPGTAGPGTRSQV